MARARATYAALREHAPQEFSDTEPGGNRREMLQEHTDPAGVINCAAYADGRRIADLPLSGQMHLFDGRTLIFYFLGPISDELQTVPA